MRHIVCRRRFLTRGTLMLASASLLPVLRLTHAQPVGASQSDATIYKSLKWGMIGVEGSVLDKFRLVGELGFAGVELDSPGGVNPEEARMAALQTGVAMEGVVDSKHWEVRLTDPDANVRLQARNDLNTALKDSHAAGGSSVLLVPGHGRDGTVREVNQRASEQIRAVLPLAARLGIHILIENVWNEMFYQHDGPDDQSAQQLADFVDALHSPWVGVHFDIGNHQKYGRPADWIRTLGKRIVKLDVKDWSTKSGFCKIGDGDVDWQDVRTALSEIEFAGWAAAEVAGGDRDALADVSHRMDQVLALTG